MWLLLGPKSHQTALQIPYYIVYIYTLFYKTTQTLKIKIKKAREKKTEHEEKLKGSNSGFQNRDWIKLDYTDTVVGEGSCEKLTVRNM